MLRVLAAQRGRRFANQFAKLQSHKKKRILVRREVTIGIATQCVQSLHVRRSSKTGVRITLTAKLSCI